MRWSDVRRGEWKPDDVAGLVAADARHVWHPYDAMPATNSAIHPVVAAEGVRLELADGRVLVDGMSSWWAAIHGYNHPVLNAAVSDQLAEMAHVMLGGLTHPQVVDLAERLIAWTPEPLEHVFFADSGSVAVEVAIKMAVQYWAGRARPDKRRLVSVRGGYHGDTFGAMSVCDPEAGMHRLFTGVIAEQIFADRPTPRFGQPFEDRHIEGLAALIEAHAHEVAAVIIEPVVQGAGGMYFYSPDYLRRLRSLCERHEVLLILDEIATGFGRTGVRFASEHAGVDPDIACVGKAMTAGYLSMGATLCTAEVAAGVGAAPPGALMHGPTFMGNPLAAAVANANIDLLDSWGWQSRVHEIQALLMEHLAPAAALDAVVDVRVLGAIGVIETASPIAMDATQSVLMGHGVWLRPFGRLLYTMPPYVSTDDDVRMIGAAMVAAATELPEP
jgi:adenosylmethionine---8-amino-7-oxononanoate aminotransferase